MKRQDAQWQVFRYAQQSALSGYYTEFGVWFGASMASAWENWQELQRFCSRYKKDQAFDLKGFVGYDSFEGLPCLRPGDEGYGAFYAGRFANVDYAELCERLPFARFEKGWFKDTLPKEEIYPIAIAHIDCDIYSSTVEVLDFLKPRLVDGAVLLFDDWFCYKGRSDKGERKAWLESGLKAQEYFNYAVQGKCMIYEKCPDEKIGGTE
ncbi:MAG: hypothetical protein GTN99_07055 [Candidatus Dadabacteria bacterium]|nr:hypothetical protein [Candidatus Dadabacteria bacterium]